MLIQAREIEKGDQIKMPCSDGAGLQDTWREVEWVSCRTNEGNQYVRLQLVGDKRFFGLVPSQGVVKNG